jgi:hypothetical protein
MSGHYHPAAEIARTMDSQAGCSARRHSESQRWSMHTYQSVFITVRAASDAEKGVPHIWRVDTNGHDTGVMSNSLYHFAQKLFKE